MLTPVVVAKRFYKVVAEEIETQIEGRLGMFSAFSSAKLVRPNARALAAIDAQGRREDAPFYELRLALEVLPMAPQEDDLCFLVQSTRALYLDSATVQLLDHTVRSMVRGIQKEALAQMETLG